MIKAVGLVAVACALPLITVIAAAQTSGDSAGPPDLRSATVDIQSRCDGPLLRQEISIGNVCLLRTFARNIEQKRLIVMVGPSD